MTFNIRRTKNMIIIMKVRVQCLKFYVVNEDKFLIKLITKKA
jgi:hypothetical protein